MSVVRPLALGLLAALLLPAVPPAEAFDIFASPATRRTLNLNLGTTQFQTLGYGVKSWNDLAEDAMNVWNDAGVGGTPDHGFFQVSTGGSADPCVRDGVNEVRFAATLCGFSWGSILAVAITRFDDKHRGVETDVIFNNTITIDAYPGSLRSTIDFVRVAIHEFGHTMGLDHPDEAGQSVSAIMNAFVSNIDTIQADDSAGARAIAWDAPPTAHVEDFVRGFYRDILGRRGHEAEVAAWVAYLLTNPNAVPAASGMAHGFLESGEHLATATTHAAYVGRLYATILGRTPTAAETGAWVGVIADRFNQVLPGFINSPEFQSLLATTSSATIITRFYQETLGRSPSASELAAWESVVASTGDWSAVARGFLNSAEYLAGSRTVAGHVTVLYRTFLGRTPSTAEAAGWVGALVAQLAALEDTFLASNEFRTRSRVLFR